LIKGLLGLNDRLGGRVSLFGTPLDRFRDHARLGYVPQRHTLSNSVRATVTEIVAIGRLPHQNWLGRPNQRDRRIIEESLAVVGLDDRATVDVSTLSGGQQRRVLIARALAAQPDVLVMDEPTAGVDLANQEVLSQVLARLAGRGATMLIVTHELHAVRNVLTRIIQINGGRITFDGTPADYARSEDAQAPGNDGHHHDDDKFRPAFPAAGPLDRIDHQTGGHGA
ncbi:MAG TPA: metal ABC transporter ATP-binding protein, partial [Dermatophilaceae bacterium]